MSTPQSGPSESDPGDEQPDRDEHIEADRPFPFPIRSDPMVPPGAFELHDEDGIVYRGWL